ncbi:MAG: hypothetical protein Q4Q22_05655 [Methanosphaera sp.]|nr:hypothetical protein [Methanosphaera sp.]
MNYGKIIKILIIFLISSVLVGSVTAGFFDNPDALKGSGEYIIGEDIPAGEYYVKCTSGNLYVQVSSDSSGDLDSIVYNLNTEGGAYVTVKEGQYFKVQGGEVYELDKAPEDKKEDGYYKDGMFKVGTDIPAGEYNVEAASGLGYVEVASSSSHQLSDIITNDNFEGNKHVTISDGQYITLSNGAQIKAE